MTNLIIDSEIDLLELYCLLRERFGHRKKWFGESPYEVIVGAVLVQNTAWTNVEKAIANLKQAELLDAKAILTISDGELKKWIRPSGCYNQKADRLKLITHWWWERCQDHVERLDGVSTPELREELLDLNGIGPETADSVLLYAIGRAIFVVDNYTRRIMSRLGVVGDKISYVNLQALFEDNLPLDVMLFNDFHAQFIALAKAHCRVRSICLSCPLVKVCPSVSL